MSGRRGAGTLRGPLLAFLGVVLLLGIVGFFARDARRFGAWPDRIRIATATEGGTYHVIGQGIAAILRDDPELRIEEEGIAAEESSGSRDNIDRLARGETELALVSAPVLRMASEPEKDRIRTLARLYDGYVQVVARRGAGLDSMADLTTHRIYIGKRGSGTEMIARVVLEESGVGNAWRRACADCGFGAAAEKLTAPHSTVDVAIFAGGLPTSAVRRALDSGTCELLDLGRDAAGRIAARLKGGARAARLPSGFYRNEEREIDTVATPALLVCRADLHPELAQQVVSALFDNVDKLLTHALLQEGAPGAVASEAIRVQDAFPDAAGPYHPGSLRFQQDERQKIFIATGTLFGRYHDIGSRIQMLLEQAGAPSRVAHTDGSYENARLLSKRPLLAIMQYDAALATTWGKPGAVYKAEWGGGVPFSHGIAESPHVPGMRSVARLHEEMLHVIVRRDALSSAAGEEPRIAELAPLRVCLGPDGSGTQALANAVLIHHDVEPATTLALPVRDMKSRLLSGDIQAGFFVAACPSPAMQDLLGADSELTLVGVDPEKVARLTAATSAIQDAEFACDGHESYGCLNRGVRTLATRALLVTTTDMPQVGLVTRALFQGAALLGMEGEEALGAEGAERSMAVPLASIEPHADAIRVYEERGLRVAPDRRVLETMAAILASLAVLVGAYRGAQLLREERLVEKIRGDVLRIAHQESPAAAVHQLAERQSEVRRRALRKWWQRGALSNARCNRLEAMIHGRIEQTQAALSRSLIREARTLRHENDEEALAGRCALRERLWEHAANGELSELQVLLALRAMGEGAG